MPANLTALIKKYNRELPRYTSYPTVPYWKNPVEENDRTYLGHFRNNFSSYNASEGVSLYLHLPFCESLCYFCACNKLITANHDVEERYLRALMAEWNSYRKLMGISPLIRELHLGGGTPTFFSPSNLKRILSHLFENAEIPLHKSFSVEGHPNSTTKEHLKSLYDLGFRRISYGVQDHDPEVQRIINRIQPYETTKRATEQAREVGYTSVNYDLIYGLPKQTEKSMEKTIRDTIRLRPDRIAFYSYAHLPWKSKAHQLFDEKELPSPEEKLKFYHIAKDLFLESGYMDIGMDHFALPTDELYKALGNGTIHRNFMGYTTATTHFLIGLGISAISDFGTAYTQNTAKLPAYYRRVAAGEIPTGRGYVLDEEDLILRNHIQEIACKRKTTLRSGSETEAAIRESVLPELTEFEKDGLIRLAGNDLEVSETGQLFLRNICHVFDLKMKAKNKTGKIEKKRFSQSV